MLTALVIVLRDTASRLYDRACGLGATARGILLARAVERTALVQHYADGRGIVCGARMAICLQTGEDWTFDLLKFTLARRPCPGCLRAATKGGRS